MRAVGLLEGDDPYGFGWRFVLVAEHAEHLEGQCGHEHVAQGATSLLGGQVVSFETIDVSSTACSLPSFSF